MQILVDLWQTIVDSCAVRTQIESSSVDLYYKGQLLSGNLLIGDAALQLGLRSGDVINMGKSRRGCRHQPTAVQVDAPEAATVVPETSSQARTCPICLVELGVNCNADDIKAGRSVQWLACAHPYHRACTTALIKRFFAVL